MEQLIGFIVIVAMILLYFGLYYLNKKTPLPKGCENLVNSEKCQSCSNITCQFHKEGDRKDD